MADFEKEPWLKIMVKESTPRIEAEGPAHLPNVVLQVSGAAGDVAEGRVEAMLLHHLRGPTNL